MHTKQIETADWRNALNEISRNYEGALVSLEVVGGDIGAEEQFRDQPLRGITADSSGVMVHIETTRGAHLDHRVSHPRAVRTVEADEGALIAIEIEDEDGLHNLVRFRSPMRPELLEADVE